MNYFRRFQQGSEVSYKGSKFGKELQGSKGVIDGFVYGSERAVVVSFGTGPEDHYIMDEIRDLDPWKERPKTDKDKHEKGPAVEKRKGVAKGGVTRRKGGTSQEEEAD